MPEKCVGKTESNDSNDDNVLSLLKAIKIDTSVLRNARQFEVPKTNVYCLIFAIENQFPNGETIFEEKLKKFISTRNQQGALLGTIWSNATPVNGPLSLEMYRFN